MTYTAAASARPVITELSGLRTLFIADYLRSDSQYPALWQRLTGPLIFLEVLLVAVKGEQLGFADSVRVGDLPERLMPVRHNPVITAGAGLATRCAYVHGGREAARTGDGRVPGHGN